MSDLRQQAASGVFWSGVEKLSFTGIRFLVQVILARILAPEEFGLVALVLVFNFIGIGLMDSGFNQVVIQKKKITHLDLCSIFYVNLGLGLLITAILWSLAPHVAAFYEQPLLEPLMRLFSFSVILTSIGRIHMSQLRREMAFKKLCLVTWPSMLVSGIVAVVMAWQGYGIWALAWYALTRTALESLSLWLASKWRPSMCFSYSSIRESLPYAFQMSLVRVTNLIAENMYFLVVGKMYSVSQTGYLQRAHSFRMLAAGTLGMILERVTFPLFSRMQDDLPTLRRAYLRILSLYALFFAFVMSLLAALAEPVIGLILGEKWLPSAPYLQLLCAVGFMYSLDRLTQAVIKSLGHASVLLKLTLLGHGLAAGVLIITAFHGIQAILIGQIVASVLAWFPKAIAVQRYSGAPVASQISKLTTPVICAFVQFFVVFSVVQMNDEAVYSILFGICMSILVGILTIVVTRKKFQPEFKLIIEIVPQLSFLSPLLISQSEV
jgi:teichuronic acid exporter